MALLIGHIGGERVAPWDNPRSAPYGTPSQSQPERRRYTPTTDNDPIQFGRERNARDRRAAVAFLAQQLASETAAADTPEEFSEASDAYRRSQEMTQSFDRPEAGRLDRFENGRVVAFVDLFV